MLQVHIGLWRPEGCICRRVTERLASGLGVDRALFLLRE
jgi:hypothetical protein